MSQGFAWGGVTKDDRRFLEKLESKPKLFSQVGKMNCR